MQHDHAAQRRGGHLLDRQRPGRHRLQRDGHLHRHRRQLQRLFGQRRPGLAGKAASTTTVTTTLARLDRGHLGLHRHRHRPGGTPAGTVAWTGGQHAASTMPLTAGVATCSIANAQASTAYSARPPSPTPTATTAALRAVTARSRRPRPPRPPRSRQRWHGLDGGTLVFTATVTGPGGIRRARSPAPGSACSSHRAAHRLGGHLLDPRRPGSVAYGVTATFTDTDGNYSGSSLGHRPASPGRRPTTPTITNLPGAGPSVGASRPPSTPTGTARSRSPRTHPACAPPAA